jgi:hypothetical protein
MSPVVLLIFPCWADGCPDENSALPDSQLCDNQQRVPARDYQGDTLIEFLVDFAKNPTLRFY